MAGPIRSSDERRLRGFNLLVPNFQGGCRFLLRLRPIRLYRVRLRVSGLGFLGISGDLEGVQGFSASGMKGRIRHNPQPTPTLQPTTPSNLH